MIDKKIFLKLIEEEFQAENEKCKIDFTTEYKNLEVWSSMLALMVIVQITDSYDIVLDAEDLRASPTIDDLYNLVVLKRKKLIDWQS